MNTTLQDEALEQARSIWVKMDGWGDSTDCHPEDPCSNCLGLIRAYAVGILRAKAEEAEATALKVYAYASLYGEYKRRATELRAAADALEGR